MTLEETAAAMFSEDYTERFQAEYFQTKIRTDKLREMVKLWMDGKLPYEPRCDINLYIQQLAIMNSYVHILEERAKEEGIEL